VSTFLVTGADLAPQAMILLQGHDVIFAGEMPTEADVVALSRHHNPEAIIMRYSKVGAAAMDAAPALKVVSKHGTGTDTIDKVAAKKRDIEVVVAVAANASAVAEQALALLLACTKSVARLNTRMHAGHWDKSTHKSIDLGGRTIGLIGLGAIGLRLARMVDAMNMRILGFDPFTPQLPNYVSAVDLETIWRESDFISFHCPLTDENHHLLNDKTMAQCKRGVILINTARGGLIDEKALLNAVRSGQVMSAGLDSFAVEPMAKDHPFQREQGFVLSPHIGGVTHNAYVNMGVASVTNALAVLARLR